MLKDAPQISAEELDPGEQMVTVPKADLVEAWKLLEAMTVSVATIGRCFSQPSSGPMDEGLYRDMLDAMDDYLSAELLQRFNKARFLIGDCVPESELEQLSEEAEELADVAERLAEGAVPYWTYDGFEARQAKLHEERLADRPRPPEERNLEE